MQRLAWSCAGVLVGGRVVADVLTPCEGELSAPRVLVLILVGLVVSALISIAIRRGE